MRRKKITGTLRKVPRRYWYWLPSQTNIKFEDSMVVRIKYPPVSLIRMWRSEYWDYMWDHMWGEERLPKEFEDTDLFFDRIVYDVFEEKGFGCVIHSGGDGSYCPVKGAHFRRPYVYNKTFFLAMVLDKKFSLNPFCRKEDGNEPRYFYVNNKRVKSYQEVEDEIRIWLDKLKKYTDTFELKANTTAK